jgi:hypothetical protein
MARTKPAVRIILAPLAFKSKSEPALLLGEAHKERRTILIDPRAELPHKTLFHELTHIRHPRWEEAKVEAWENEQWGKMGWKKKAELLRMFGSALLQGEDED